MQLDSAEQTMYARIELEQLHMETWILTSSVSELPIASIWNFRLAKAVCSRALCKEITGLI